MSTHFFTIEGDRVSGKYIVFESNNGHSKKIFEVSGKHNGGLKEARQTIGEYLKKRGYPLNKAFKHECIKPGRKYNSLHEWTIDEYLIGIPLKK